MTPVTIKNIRTADLRFPTSRGLHGSDAMNAAPDYSCAYVVLETSDPGLTGYGLTFTIGRGNELCVAAVDALAPLVLGRDLDGIENGFGAFWRTVVGDSQLRWLGPEKGVVHLAAAAIVNAVWDALAKRAGKPVWQYVAHMPSEQIVSAIDFRHITDFITPERALERLKGLESSRATRTETLLSTGYPAYTTSAGWLGYADTTFKNLLHTALDAGWRRMKIKVGRDLHTDMRRLGIARDIVGPDALLMIDANQVWDVGEAIANINALAEFGLHWVEEPTSPDDIIGHHSIAGAVAPVRLASGEHCHNRIMFKQFIQTGALSFLQVDACRLAGLNEVLAVCLMAAERDIPVCPHAGGVGLSEYAQHLSMIDYICFSGTLTDRVIEHGGQLHGLFYEPIEIVESAYMPPARPGFSIDLRPGVFERHLFPYGAEWAGTADTYQS